MNKQNSTLNMVLSAMFIGIGLVLPFVTGQIPEIGKALSPMHIPVYLCGFICGWPYGLIVGFILPLLRSVIFHMPALYPDAVGMAFELATYGFVTGVVYGILKNTSIQKLVSIYVTLVIAMLCGRVVWGIARLILLGIQGTAFTFEMFLAGAFIKAVPGIIVHLLLIPPIVFALERTKRSVE